MDVIVIGKKNFARSEVPAVIYCGQSREAALAAVAKANGEYPFVYYVNPEPYQRIAVAAGSADFQSAVSPASQPAGSAGEPSQSHKPKSKTK